MQLTFDIKSAQHALLAAEFMAKFYKLDNPEEIFHYNAAKEVVKESPVTDAEVKAAVQEAEAEVAAEEVAEKAVAKAAETSKPANNVTKAALQALARQQSIKVGAPKVKALIGTFGTNINDVPEDKLPDLQRALEALAA